MQLLLSITTLLVVTPTSFGFIPATNRVAFSGVPTAIEQQTTAPVGSVVTGHTTHWTALSASSSEPAVDVEQIRKDADVIFSVIDDDGDGSITLKEMTAHMTKSGYAEEAVAKIFGKLDINSDGSVSKEEFRAGLVRYSPLRSAPVFGNYNSQFLKEIHEDADAVFRSVDRDNNGDISKKELQDHLGRVTKYSDAAIANIFDALDANDDGSISKEELRDAFAKYSALRQAMGEGPNYK